MVFDRNVGGQVREFGISGMLYNSNVLLYDRQRNLRQESLWSQAEMRAVTGPAAGEGLTLQLLPSELTTLEDWRARHPQGKIMSEQTGHKRNYRSSAYGRYFMTDRLMFPVTEKRVRPTGFKNKELMVIVRFGEDAKAYAVKDIAKHKDGVEDVIGGQRIRLVPVGRNTSVRVERVDGEVDPAVAYMFWFALSAMQSEVALYESLPGGYL